MGKQKAIELIFFLLLWCFIGPSSNVNAQAANKVAAVVKQVDVDESTMPLEKILELLEEKYDVTFFYKSDIVKNTNVSKNILNLNNFQSVLGELSKQLDLQYEKVGKRSLFIKRPLTKVLAEKKTEIISGTVTDVNTNETLPGVNIRIKGTSSGTSTGPDGTYSLEVESLQDTLIFSFVGYKEEIVPIDGRTTINVAMKMQALQGKEMVVVGYGTQNKSEVTGSIATIDGTDLQEAPVTNISNSLEGRLPGVIINTRTGEAGNALSSINIRGQGTLNNNAPLVVIDGVPSTNTEFNRLNPADIKNVSVLKDASAAIYGAEAANGVILVTTKEGRKGKPQITYNGSFGLSQPTKIPDIVNGWQFMQWKNEVAKYNSTPSQFTQDQVSALKNGTYNPRQYANTDWLHALIKPLSSMTTHQVQISGGSDDVRYLVSGQYLYQDGIFKKSATHWNQKNLRSNIDADITKNLNVSVKISGRVTDKNYSNTGSGEIFYQAQSDYPYLPVKYPNGGFSGAPSLPNPVVQAQGETGYRKYNYYVVNSILSFNLKMPEITKGLYINGQASYSINNNDAKTLNNRYDIYSYEPKTDTYINNRSQEPPISISQNSDKYIFSDYTLKLGYKRSFGSHHIAGFAAFERTKNTHNYMSAYRQGLLSDQIPELSFGADELKDNSGGKDYYGPEGLIRGGKQDYFGRINYDYRQKYLVEITLRRDGSFRFPTGHRWGTFPAVSAGWRISDEPFFKDNINFISDLKVKASWGKMGNDQILPYQYLNSYSFGTGYSFGTKPDHYRGFVAGVTPNPNITWEIADKKNVGINATLLNGLFSIEVDYFYSKRDNILLARNASVPDYTGLSLPDENIGKVNNHGIDGSIMFQNKSGHFDYKLAGNFTFARNKVVYMDESPNIPAWQKIEGHPMSSWLVYKTNGIYKNQQEIDDSPHLSGTQPGDIKYIDYNNDGEITPNDRYRIYQSATPEIQYGLNMQGGYKGFHLSILLQGQSNAKQLIRPSSGNNAVPVWMFNNRWTPNNPNAKYPRAFAPASYTNARSSTLWLKNAWFLRFKTAQLSYTLPKKLISRFGARNLQLYVSGQNLFSLSAIKNYDPELSSSTGQYYPQIRIFNVGVSLDL